MEKVDLKKKKKKNRPLRIALWTVGVLLAWFVGHIVYVVIDGGLDRGLSADYAVVLGNPVNTDGSLSDRLESRLECGIKLYFDGRVKGIIVSGAYGDAEFYEADRMKDYLRSRGIPEGDIVVDNMGGSTRNTVENVLKLRDRLHYNSLIVVSQYYHLTRCKMLFRTHGFKEVSSVGARYFQLSDFYYVPREVISFYTQL